MKKVKFIEVRSEIGAGTRGASLGVDAIKIAALDSGSFLFNQIESVEIPHENQLLFELQGSPYAKRIQGTLRLYERMIPEIVKTLHQKMVPIVLGGDHSIAGGTIAGIKKAYPDLQLGVIWIDAHADIHSPYTTPSGNLHGMTLSTALAEDNLADQINKPDKATLDIWSKLKEVGGISPKISYKDLVYIALRDTEFGEADLLKKKKVKIFTTAELKKSGVEKIARNTFNHLKQCDLIYISFDVDSMDASIVKGTGVPVRNGINEKEAGNLLMRLVQNEKVCCLEFSEINPTLDTENRTAEIAFGILQKVITQIQH